MEVITVALAIGTTLAVLTGGSLGDLVDTRVRLWACPCIALAAQLLLHLSTPGSGWPDTAAFGIHLASLVALAVFCVANLRLTGMSVVLLGVILNTTAVAFNGGMPLRGEQRDSPTHVPEDGATLAVLGQTIPAPGPFDRPVSFGDLILGVGLVDLLFRASRPRRETRQSTTLTLALAPDASGARTAERSAGDDPGESGEDAAVAAGGW